MPVFEPFRYYAVDHAAMLLCFAAMWLIGNKNPAGFVIFMIGNACWVAFGVLTESFGVVVGNLGFILLNARGLWHWIRERRALAIAE